MNGNDTKAPADPKEEKGAELPKEPFELAEGAQRFEARHLEPVNSRPGGGLSFCATALHQQSFQVLEAILDLLPHVRDL